VVIWDVERGDTDRFYSYGFWMIIWQEILWAMENAGYDYYEPF